MGMKPRANPVPVEEDNRLLTIDEMEPSKSGTYKTAGILLPFMGEALEVKIHRKSHAPDITAMNITKVNFKRCGRGMAAMQPGAEKELLLTVRYVDRT